MNRSYWESNEPVFLEALDEIDDEYVKTILLGERRGLTSTAGISGLVICSIYTSTKDMARDESISFYKQWVDNIKSDIIKKNKMEHLMKMNFIKKDLKKVL